MPGLQDGASMAAGGSGSQRLRDIDSETFLLDSEIRGHHVYKSAWTPVVGEILHTERETMNSFDPFAVATTQRGQIVGHMPRDISRVSCFFLQHGGSITCEVTGPRKHSGNSDKGLVVPCTYQYVGKPKLIKRLIKVILCTKYSK